MASNSGASKVPDIPTLDTMSLDAFKMWTDSALKVFLSVRKRLIKGTSHELAARAFIAWEEQIPINSNLEHLERLNVREYRKKLMMDDGSKIPDALEIPNGWNDESQMVLWPSLYFSDIADYLKLKTPSELYHKLCNEYKQGKSFRYFTCGWVKKVMYHPISDNSRVCLLKTTVTPSMSLSQQPYHVWACLEKDVDNHCGGRIESAYCTCPAGLQGSCNHIAGLLFRVEYAVRTGITKPSCTTTPSVWNVPCMRNILVPTKVCDMKWKKDHYCKDLSESDDHSASVHSLASEFSPLSPTQEEYCQNKIRLRTDLANLLRNTVPDSCFMQLWDKKRFRVKNIISCPDTPLEIGKRVDTPDRLFMAMSLTVEDVKNISKLTVEQSCSDDWVAQRKGRITSSNIHDVFTKMNSIIKKSEDKPVNLVTKIMGYKPNVIVPAMKHGLAMEPHAKRKFKHIFSANHKKVSYSESGLVVYQNEPYLAASPDLVIECSCHGKSLCEIKCPHSIRDKVPSNLNLTYLVEKNGNVHLNTKYKYFSQIQAQMGILGISHCHFFIYTSHGYHLETIQFDNNVWNSLVERSRQFWFSYIAPEVISGEIRSNIVKQNVPVVEMYTDGANTENPTSTVQISCQYDQTMAETVLDLCGECNLECVSNPKTWIEGSIECTSCQLWFHFPCINIKENDEILKDDIWLCKDCDLQKM